MRTREIVFTGVNTVALVERDLPPPASGEIAVETLYSYISGGTERAKLTGLQTVPFPYVAGNRAVGRVVAVGPDIRDVSVGDTVLTHTPHASHAVTSAFRVRVPPAVPLEQAAVSALALVALTALRVSPPQLGDRVVVVGLGPVGMIAVQLFAIAGVEVIGIDVDPARLALARRVGAAHAILGGTATTTEEVLAVTGGEGARIVVEATGIPAMVEVAMGFARQSGDCVLLGSPRGEYVADMTPLLNKVHLWRKQATVTLKGGHEWQFPFYRTPFTRHSIEENAEAIFALIARGKLDLSACIGRIVGPEAAPEVYRGLAEAPADWSGVLFGWRR